MAGTGWAVAPGSPNFALHTLGWRAFQDLCAAVLRQVWGQSVHAFADSNDAGRDGAFYGIWAGPAKGLRDNETLAGPFVLQCKHTKDSSATLSVSMLNDEFDKVHNLVKRGACSTYVLLTNARVTGASDEAIRSRLLECGVRHPLVLDGQWLSDMIAAHRDLRMFVPRVYGLGDLSQILDERAYAQASVLLASAPEQVSTFVVTGAYRKAAQALRDHGFVLLLGNPAVGKSVIAMMLAISAADNWSCLTVKARTSEELVQRWNPHERDQLFWLDDAFGAVRHEEHLTHAWARDLPHVMSAVKNGARVVLTSRSYIYNEARPLLKPYAYPLLHEQQVTVDVADITRKERQQIIYNHLAAGDQPVEVRRQMKPHLEIAADVKPFYPEAARRLGLQAFTRSLPLTELGITTFMALPRQFLSDVYDQLDSQAHAALALTYAAARDNGLTSPVEFDAIHRDIIERAGATAGGTTKALTTLTGTFLQLITEFDGRACWRFLHPTLREGFAAWLATQQHLLPVILTGMDDDAILYRTDCLDPDSDQRHGTLLRIPPPLYPEMAQRLAAIHLRPPPQRKSWRDPRDVRRSVLNYLDRYSSRGFLRSYAVANPELFELLLNFHAPAADAIEPRILARLCRANLLPEEIRQRAVSRMTTLAISAPDASWIEDLDWQKKAWHILLSDDERLHMFERARRDLAPRLLDIIGNWQPSGDHDDDDDDDPIENALFWYSQAFERLEDWDTAYEFDLAREVYKEERRSLRPNDNDDRGVTASSSGSQQHAMPDIATTQRSIFDDIDQ